MESLSLKDKLKGLEGLKELNENMRQNCVEIIKDIEKLLTPEYRVLGANKRTNILTTHINNLYGAAKNIENKEVKQKVVNSIADLLSLASDVIQRDGAECNVQLSENMKKEIGELAGVLAAICLVVAGKCMIVQNGGVNVVGSLLRNGPFGGFLGMNNLLNGVMSKANNNIQRNNVRQNLNRIGQNISVNGNNNMNSINHFEKERHYYTQG